MMGHEVGGDLPGHVFPALSYVLWASWWIAGVWRLGGVPFRDPWSTASHPDLAGLRAGPWEARLKILIPILGMIGDGRRLTLPITDLSVSNYQHMTGYLVIMLSGLADLLTAKKVLPRGSDRLALALAFFVPGFILAVHGHHMAVPVIVHRLLAAVFVGVSLLVLLEWWRPAPALRWASVYGVGLTGTWFFQIAWMLYLAGYDLHSEAVAIRSGLFFAWHLLGVAALLAAVYAVLARRTPPAPIIRSQ